MSAVAPPGGEAPPIAGTEDQPHARATLAAALATGPSHAYLFHGPAGVGKREAARAFAAELLAQGADDPAGVRHRVGAGTHPDLTWVRPTGAHVMRTEDVDGPVVAAAGRTPFEASRRVFVLERVDEMNDEVANRLLKTLEEPPPSACLILLTDSLGQVIETVVSRCQPVRFGALGPARVEELLAAAGITGAEGRACARLAMGNADRARFLASPEGRALRSDVERVLASALLGPDETDRGTAEPWRALLTRAEAQREEAESEVGEARTQRLESEPKGRERGALERRFEETAKRDGRRARTQALELGLTLVALGFRDLVCLAEGADGACLDPGRPDVLRAAAAERSPAALREAAERCEETRLSLELNVTEDLALEALSYRLAKLVGPG